MSEWLLPVGVSVAALALTYLFCLRPMRRGHCTGAPRVSAPARGSAASGAASGSDDLDQALHQARTELARLRTGDASSGGDVGADHAPTAGPAVPSTRGGHIPKS